MFQKGKAVFRNSLIFEVGRFQLLHLNVKFELVVGRSHCRTYKFVYASYRLCRFLIPAPPSLKPVLFPFQASFSLNVSLLLRKPLSNSGQNPILRAGTEVSSNGAGSISNAAAIASDSISNSDLSDELDLSHDGNGGRTIF